jgi:hypothetical protein
MKTSSLLGILAVSSVAEWAAVACAGDTAPQSSPRIVAIGGTSGSVPAIGETGGATVDGSAGTDTVGGADSGLDTTRLINQLTQSEADLLCEMLSRPALDVSSDPEKSRGSCILRVVQTAFTHVITTLDQCQQGMDACDTVGATPGQASLSGAVPSLLAAGMACINSAFEINPSCRANVGEVEGCLAAGLGVLATANQFTCSTIMSGDAARQVASILGNSGVLACQGYQSKCPNGMAISSGDAGN